ncbi:MAG: hypothetical protein H8D67_04070 [Deltaproteobacteria bacterium]|nr:hypothetical protein [Deltaproteobacteria bacterium]
MAVRYWMLDPRYWMPDHALEIVAFIQYQVTSIQHQCTDSDPTMEDIRFYHPKT